jgi:ABC-type polysaccharide/polyol phosphate transport system ATPase subunit
VHAIEVRDVHKVFRRHTRRRRFGTLKSALLSGGLSGRLRPDEVLEALRGVSFDVAQGRTFGIIGRNGSGKSTLLKLIAGIGRPTSGTISVNGRASALIELGAGFHPEISGRENVFVNGMMLGLSKREIAARFDEIVAFAGMEEFIDAPVKTYSSGMYVRLGFAVAINVDPDVLLVDEVLAVGDEAFTHKCLDKFAELRQRGRTVLLVTHTLDLVTRFCDEALWLDGGAARAQGDPRQVIDAYLLDVARVEAQGLAPQGGGAGVPIADAPPAGQGPARWGSREAEIVEVIVARADGTATRVLESDDPIDIRLRVRASRPLDDVVFGFGLFNADGVCCYGTNTAIDGVSPGGLSGDGEACIRIDRLGLVAGSYTLDVALHRRNGAPYDYHRRLYAFRVVARVNDTGICRLPHRWTFSGGVRTS